MVVVMVGGWVGVVLVVHRSIPQDNWSSTASSGKANDWRNRARVFLDLFSNLKFVRSSGYFGELLNHVITIRGQILVSRTNDDPLLSLSSCPPCVDSTRPCVYVQNVPVCTGTTPACVTTCGRGACTHGGRFEFTHGGFLDGHTTHQTPPHTTHTHTTHKHRTHTTTHGDRQTDKVDRKREKRRRKTRDKRRQHERQDERRGR